MKIKIYVITFNKKHQNVLYKYSEISNGIKDLIRKGLIRMDFRDDGLLPEKTSCTANSIRLIDSVSKNAEAIILKYF